MTDFISGSKSQKLLRKVLGSLEAFLALNAFGGGIYGMTGAGSVPMELLEGSPFRSYFIPSLILFILVGGGFTLAAIATFTRWKSARKLSFAAVAIVLVWLAVQIAIIGYISWMQPVTAVIGLSIFILALIYRY
jgi:peptidoglycan/LPS O-acetylase OafA/YrhL